MATQKDLDKLRKQLSDLDAKLKSMRGNQKAPVARPPNFVDMGRDVPGRDVPRTPIDMVRDPGFGSALDQRNYRNIVDDIINRINAGRGNQGQQAVGNFTQGRLMGAPTEQQPEFGDIARQLPPQLPFNPNAPSLMPIRTPGSDALNQDLANRGMGGGIPAPIPQNPQMATYNNLLQQGIQRSNTMNQGAMTDFANMQAGTPTTQPAAPAKANQTMPTAGMGMQQPKQASAPRKFSTAKAPSARFA